MDRRKKRLRILTGTALALYALALVYLMLLRRTPYESRACSLVPLRTIRGMLRYLLAHGKEQPQMGRILLINLAGNVAAFLPLGFLLPCLWAGLRRWWRTALLSAAVVAALEALQYVTCLGSADVDDLLLNLVGVSLGYAVFRILESLHNN